MKVCIKCKTIPTSLGKSTCEDCTTVKKVIKKETSKKSNYHKKEFWIETPHKIIRSYKKEDNFNNFY